MSTTRRGARSITKIKREISDVTNGKEEPAETQIFEKIMKKVKKQEIKEEASENEENDNHRRSLRKRKYVARYVAEDDEDDYRNIKIKKEEEEDGDFKCNDKVEEDEDEDDFADYDYEEDSRPRSSSGRIRSKTNVKRTVHYKSSRPMKSLKEDQDETVKTVKFVGDIPVDERFIEIFGTDYRVYKEADLVYDCMLNQTNLQHNNNKFYVIQLLQNTSKCIVWLRWGRVGQSGQTASFDCDLNEAKEIFINKFYDKTRNEFGSGDFEKLHGKYDLVEKDYSIGEKELEFSEQVVKKEVPPSKLEKPVQELIDMICDIKEMESILKEMKFDTKKAPLGKLSTKQIKAGYAALKEIEALLNLQEFGKKFVQANNDFYTRIPHNFGMKIPPLIRTFQQMKEKMKLLEVLDEIEIAVNTLNQESDIVNPIDRQYEQFDCEMKPLEKTDKLIPIIDAYLQKNHAPTHANYTLKLLEVFAVRKEKEHERFKNSDNRMLLWHGSRMTNWAGILSQGLRIAPPEAPVTGYMFGKGCYFSDCSSKSANYCYSTSNKNIGILSLSEVSLGTCNELKQADYDADKLPKGTFSTKGVGKSEPDSSDWVTLEDGCVVPIGQLKNMVSPEKASEYSLLYNEFIVYDVSQVKLRYLVKVEFVYDD